MVNNIFSCDYKILAWQYSCTIWGGNEHEIAYAGIWRPLDDNYDSLILVHKTRLRTARYGLLTATIPSSSVLVKQGDVIGVHVAQGATGPITSNRNGGDSDTWYETYQYQMKDNVLPEGTVVTRPLNIKYRRFRLKALMESPGM